MTLTKKMLAACGVPCEGVKAIQDKEGEHLATCIGRTIIISEPMVEIACPDDFVIIRVGEAKEIIEEGEYRKTLNIDGVERPVPPDSLMMIEIGKNVPAGTPVQITINDQIDTVFTVAGKETDKNAETED